MIVSRRTQFRSRVWGAMALFAASISGAATYYVAPGGTDGAAGTDWTSAWKSLDHAVGHMADGDQLWVSNGIYSVTAEISVTNAITIRGYAGADNTSVTRTGSGNHRIFALSYDGATLDGLTVSGGYVSGSTPANYGAGVYMTAAATIQNCSIVSNTPPNGGAAYGGGVYMTAGTVSNCWFAYNGNSPGNNQNIITAGGGVYMTGGLIVDCVFEENQAYNQGGGLYLSGGTVARSVFVGNHGDNRAYDGGAIYCNGAGTLVRNCLIYNNRYRRGAGAYVTKGVIESCTITENTASEFSGGVYAADGVTVRNCIIVGNTSAPATVNIDPLKGSYLHCLTEPLVAGTGNIAGDPQFVDAASRNYRILSGSGCIDAGTNQVWMVTATDFDGNSRINGSNPDIGVYEYRAGALACSFVANVTAGFDPLNLTFTAAVDGTNTTSLTYYWDVDGDGTNDVVGGGQSSVVTQLVSGIYSPSLTVSNDVGEGTSLTKAGYVKVGPTTIYAALTGSDTFPYASWESAAANIQNAVDAGVHGSLVLVSNGIYKISGQITVSDGITVRGATGDPADVTLSQGSYNYRCFSLSHSNAVVENMTLTKHVSQGGGVQTYYGGTIRNCIIHGCKQDHSGGGVHLVSGGTVQDCVISNNVSRRYGGVYTYSGYNSNPMLIERCVIDNNHAATYDANTTVGGVYLHLTATLRNSLIINNRSLGESGGVYVSGGTVENCTVVSNETYSAAALAVGGAHVDAAGSLLRNSILVDNINSTTSQETNWRRSKGTIEYCCTLPDASAYGSGNITDVPVFVAPTAIDFRLAPASPGINQGIIDASWMEGAVDLAGLQRVAQGAVDMGAYEFQPPAGTMLIMR